MRLFKKMRLKKQSQRPDQADSYSPLSEEDNLAASDPSGEQEEEASAESDQETILDKGGTVWIPPEQAAKFLSGGQPLNEGTEVSLLENQEYSASETEEKKEDTPEADVPKEETPELDIQAEGTPKAAIQVEDAPEVDVQVEGTPEISLQVEEAPEEDTIVYRRNPRKGRKTKAMGKIIFSLLVLLIIAYLGGRYFFQNHFFPNTYVDGTDLGIHSIDRAEEIMTSRLQAETLELIENDENEYLTGKQVGLHYTSFDQVEKALKKQDAAKWFLFLGNHTDYGNLEVDVDSEKLSAALDELHCMNPDQPVKPENAKLYYNPEKHKYMVQDETYGNIINREAFLQAVKDGFLNRSSSLSIQDQTYFVQADIKKDNEALQTARNTMNTWLKGIVKYKDGDLKLKLTRDEISGFIECSDDFKTSINKKKVKKYVENKVVKTFNSLDGDIPQGLTAWKVHVKKETKALIKDIKTGKKVTRTPVYASQGLAEGEYNLGSTYIDVNIPNQEMWYVENGKVVFNSDVVTGNISTGHGTSTGIYHIQYKQRDHMMVKYHSFVHYWMPYNTTIGVGFHDANWRSSFGGEIYRYNGSHGCINMPPAKAEELFYMISSGTVVYVHE